MYCFMFMQLVLCSHSFQFLGLHISLDQWSMNMVLDNKYGSKQMSEGISEYYLDRRAHTITRSCITITSAF
jgi:hypothetical protein